MSPDPKHSITPTPRERDLMMLIARGMQNKNIAYELKISENTARNSYDIAPSARARFWRLLADAPTGGGHWGVIELRFSQYPVRRSPGGPDHGR